MPTRRGWKPHLPWTGESRSRATAAGKMPALPGDAAATFTIYTFYTANFPRSVGGRNRITRSFNHLDNGLEVGGRAVGWEPDLNEGGTKQERVYTVEGRESLTDGDWGPTNAASLFFRVKVGMP